MPRKEIVAFFTALPKIVSDPITGIRPSREVELSAILATFQQHGRIDWLKAGIRMWSPTEGDFISDSDTSRPVSAVLSEKGRTLTEYPLFSETDKQWKRWGEMSADVLFVTERPERVILFENKLDSKFTYDDNPPDGQLSRQIEYLIDLPEKVEKRFLILTFPETNLEWYVKRLRKAAEETLPSNSNVAVGYAIWEHIFAATDFRF